MQLRRHPDLHLTEALDATLKRADTSMPLDVRSAKLVVFSDLHRGAGNSADEFLRTETTYLAALWRYFQAGFTLVSLGDMEDLWKEPPARVIATHRASLQLERSFHLQGRYLRFWGNHDESWGNSQSVLRWLHPVYGDALRIYESLRMKVVDGTRHLGELLFLHGHQGTWDGERLSTVARPVVRHIWRLVQLCTGWSSNQPENVLTMSRGENIMQDWAMRNGLKMVTGHTHRPMVRRRYLNSGACCFSDGSITGLEIDSGEVRHIQWNLSGSTPNSIVISHAPLVSVLA